MTTGAASPETSVGQGLHVSKDVWPGTNIYYLTRTSFQANKIAQQIPNRIFVNVLDSDFTGRIGLTALGNNPPGPTDVVGLYIQSSAGAGTKCNVFALNPLVNKTGPFQAHCCELDINNSYADEAAYNDPYASVGLDIEAGVGGCTVATALNIGGYAFAVDPTKKSWHHGIRLEYGFDTCGLYMRPWTSSPSDAYIYLLNYDDNNLDTTRMIKCVNAAQTVETFVLTKRGEIFLRDIRGSDNTLGIKNISNPADGVIMAIDNINTNTRLVNLATNGSFGFNINAVGGWNCTGMVTGDAKPRWILTTLGLELGDGTNNTDTKIQRSGAAALSITGLFAPSADATYDLGSPSYRWRNLYLSGTTSSGGNLLPAIDNAYDLGSGSYRWRNLYLAGYLENSLLPSANNTYNLGSASYAWSMLFLTTGVFMPGSNGHLGINSASSWQDGASIVVYSKGDTYADIDVNYGAYSAASIASLVRFNFYQNSAGTLMMSLNSSGQLALTQAGSSAGILLGGDVNLYRSAANVLKTDDSFAIGTDLYMGATDVLTAARVLQNVTADAGIVTSGRFGLARIPTGTSGYFLKGQGASDPVYALLTSTDIPSLDAAKITSGTFDSARVPWSAVAASILPSANDTYDLGSTSYKWRSVYAKETVYAGYVSVSLAAVGNVLSVFVGSEAYSEMYLTTSSIRFGPGSTDADALITRSGVATFQVTGHWYPVVNNTYDLGSDSLRWKDIHVNGTLYSNFVSADLASDGYIFAGYLVGHTYSKVGLTTTDIRFGSSDAAEDVQMGRVNANLMALWPGDGLRVPGAVRTYVKAGVPVDGDIPSAEDGALVVDSTDGKLYVRYGGAWHYAALT